MRKVVLSSLAFLIVFGIFQSSTSAKELDLVDFVKEREKVAEGRFKESEKVWKDLNKSLDELKMEQGDLEEQINLLDENINKTIMKKVKLEKDLKKKEDELRLLYIEIKQLEVELEKREDAFKERIVGASRGDLGNYFKVLLNSSGLSEVLSKVFNIKSIVEKDNSVIEEYLEIREELFKKRKDEEQQEQELQEGLKELEQIKKELEDENKENRKVRTSLVDEEEKLLNSYKSIKNAYEKEKSLYEGVTLAISKIGGKDFKKSVGLRIGDYNLHPLVELGRIELMEQAKAKGIDLMVVGSYRSFQEQDRLYSIGRGEGDERAIVTNARGGQSWHNYGLAFDLAFDVGGVPSWDDMDRNNNGISDWEEIGLIGESLGFEWGGRWTSLVDKPHFELTFEK